MTLRIIIFGFLLCLGRPTWAYIVDGVRILRPQMLTFAKTKLLNQGTLEQNLRGETYLKLPPTYMQKLFSQIPTPGYQLPLVAKISVINDLEAKKLPHLQEVGKTIAFQPLGFYTIMEDNLEYLMLAIDAPELSCIRAKYGLSAKLDNQAFALALGVRKVVAHNELGRQGP